MGVVAHSPPNYQAVFQSYNISKGPIIKQIASTAPFYTQVNGVMQMVFAYGGAMIFVEFMAEMKRPWDFWKAMICAQLLIFVCYLMYGLFVYSYQGQFTFNPANQGIGNYNWLTAINVLSLVSGLIAAALYGNIGIKVIYHNIVIDLLNGPELASSKGRVLWICMTIAYWALAFIIGSSIPNVSALSGFIAALCILQFTYTFPPIMSFGLELQRDAAKFDVYDEFSGRVVTRKDTWWNLSRWVRGLKPLWYIKLFNFLLFLSALATAALGMYASIEAIKAAFKAGHATSFGCIPSV
ncbi:unnamed protein product [Didymodactylos carnosus]|uniref:Amino acid transporter transmembrane domain-containing protein n=1 Tax=Didymodactylos carnosus TaxID=1234261 RepID=A0A814J0D8_9BILA|nr:unnamed protein product [Didymodactylos carnosus]CAF1031673.1 unnamed protein product [Didymodactylos carnosus]CAF3777070.1 unnamed protein product [Didymodactylos carnosus]CAF3802380.1 unnamed protein product [Didymodactylos carnosus]